MSSNKDIKADSLLQLKKLYGEVGFEESVIDRIFESLNTRGFTSVFSLLNAFRKKYGEECNKVLSVFFKRFIDEHEIDFFLVVKDFSVIGDPSEAVVILDAKNFKKGKFDCFELAKNKGLLAVSKSFKRRFNSLSRIFDSLWEDGSKFLPVLAWDKTGLLWEILEGELLILAKNSPPVLLLLPLFHAFKYMGDKYVGLVELEKEIIEQGLMKRVWGSPKIDLKKMESFLKEVKDYKDFSYFLSVLTATINRRISLEDFYIYLMYIMGGDSSDVKLALLKRSRLVPSDELRSVIMENRCEFIDYCVEEIRDALLESEKKWFPEVSIEEILNLPYGGSFDNYVVESWLREFHRSIIEGSIQPTKIEERVLPTLIPAIKIAISLIISKTKFKSPALSLLIRYLLSLSNRMRYMAVPVISSAINTILNLSEDELEFAIYLQRLLEIHGPRPYIDLGREVFGEMFINVVQLGLLVNSKRGLGARKIIALAMKSPKIASTLSKHISTLRGYKVRGFTIPTPWELEISASPKCIGWVKSTISFFEEVGVDPPKQILLLRDILNIRFNKEQIDQNIDRYSIREIIGLISEISRINALLDELRSVLLELFGIGDVKFIRSTEAMLSESITKLSKAFERLLLRKYGQLLEEELFVSDAISVTRNSFGNRPIILFVVDGLRYDDYLTKIRGKLVERHLKIVKEAALLSFLPSITTYSRRAIFSEEKPPRQLIFPGKVVGAKLVKEGDYLVKKFRKAMYIKGSIGEVQIKLQNMLYSEEIKGVDLVAIVLSDLEKAAHGSSEGFLSHLTLDYADEIAKAIKLAIRVYYTVNKVIPVAVLVSDHGLEKFTKIVEVSPTDIIKLAQMRGFIDPAYEVLVTPRYMIVPLISTESTKQFILEIERNHRLYLWVVRAKDLGIERISMKLKEERVFHLVEGERVVIIFPRGDKRFKVGPTRSVVYHGGLLPSEVLTPYSAIEPE